MGACNGRGGCARPGDAHVTAGPRGEVSLGSLTKPTTAAARKMRATLIDRSQLIRTQNVRIQRIYDIDADKIGEGSFGSVRKGTHRSTNAAYAVKTLSKRQMKDPEQFRQEVANMRIMDHPNITRLFEVFADPWRVYLVMQLCTGGELADHIVKKGYFLEHEAVIVMKQILRAVHYMHKLDISHRDLKPANVMYQTDCPTENSVLKLIDFGLACESKPGATLTTLVGTPKYVAPQVLARKYDKRCDLWSCGVMMYALLCGHTPFSGRDQQEILGKVWKGQYAFKSKIWQQVSQDAKTLIQKLMLFNPDRRYTAKQALGDSWIARQVQRGQSKMQMHPNLLQGLRAFQSANRLKKAALHVITKQMSDDHTKDLRDIFLSLDTDSDGTLTLTELRTGLAAAGLTEAAPDIEDIVEGLDSDGSGTVDYTEFVAAGLDQESYLKEHLCWTAFNVFDLNRDGKITQYELGKVLDNGSFKREMARAREELLRDIDEDGDGTISFTEFMAMMVRPSGGSSAS